MECCFTKSKNSNKLYNTSLIKVNDKVDYNIINTNSIFYYLKYKNSIISKRNDDK